MDPGEGLIILLRVGWRAGEGLTEKVTFELAMEVEQHFFRERRAGQQQQQQSGYYSLSPCYVRGPMLGTLQLLFICRSHNPIRHQLVLSAFYKGGNEGLERACT